MSRKQSREDADKVQSLLTLVTNSVQEYCKRVSEDKNVDEESRFISSTCQEIRLLVTPPEVWVNDVAGSYHDGIAMCLALDLKIPVILSQEQPMSLDRLAEMAGAAKVLLKLIMRQCVFCHLFNEPSPEAYALNNRSACLLDNNFAAWIHYLVDDGLRAGSSLSSYSAKTQYKVLNCRHQTSFQMANQTDKPFYEYYQAIDRRRGHRFDSAMERYFHANAQRPVETIFNFEKLESGGVVVDVGGGRGHHSMRISQKHPGLSFVVQDYERKEPTIQGFRDRELSQRVTWEVHDFYKDQPIKGANLYLLSHILMDHPDEESTLILRRLAAAMIPSQSILLVDDFIDLEPPESANRKLNMLNLHILACLGRPFRSMNEWQKLFLKAHNAFRVDCVWRDGNGRVVFELKIIA